MGLKRPIIIGKKEFKYKKDVLAHYKKILNSYVFNDSLNDRDYYDVIFLLKKFSFFNSEISNLPEEEYLKYVNKIIHDIKIYKAQYNTKSFCIEYNMENDPENIEYQYISYLQIINRHKTSPFRNFTMICRNEIQDDIFIVKQNYFNENSVKGKVKCQETGLFSTWEELVVDHRQPFTFSMIVDRFIELENIDIKNIDSFIGENNIVRLSDRTLSEKFKEYHKSKAKFRIVRKDCNLSRSGMAKISDSKNDLKVK